MYNSNIINITLYSLSELHGHKQGSYARAPERGLIIIIICVYIYIYIYTFGLMIRNDDSNNNT